MLGRRASAASAVLAKHGEWVPYHLTPVAASWLVTQYLSALNHHAANTPATDISAMVPQAALAEVIKLIVHVLEEVLHFPRGERRVCHMAATDQLLF